MIWPFSLKLKFQSYVPDHYLEIFTGFCLQDSYVLVCFSKLTLLKVYRWTWINGSQAITLRHWASCFIIFQFIYFSFFGSNILSISICPFSHHFPKVLQNTNYLFIQCFPWNFLKESDVIKWPTGFFCSWEKTCSLAVSWPPFDALKTFQGHIFDLDLPSKRSRNTTSHIWPCMFWLFILPKF